MRPALVLSLVCSLVPCREVAPQQADGVAERASRLHAIVRAYNAAVDSLTGPASAVAVNERIMARAALKLATARQLRALALANPSDTVARDAIVFHLDRLRNDESSARYYNLLAEWHATSAAIAPVAGSRFATDRFLAAVATVNPDPQLRGDAAVRLARRRADANDWRTVDSIAVALAAGSGLDVHRRIGVDLMFQARNLQLGMPLPELAGRDLDGADRKFMPEFLRVVTLVVFWAGWCEPCVRDIPGDRTLLRRYRGRPLSIVGVNSDRTAADARAAVRHLNVPWLSLRDEDLGVAGKSITARWGVRILPTKFLVDHEGVIRAVRRGEAPDTAFDSLLERLVMAAEAERNSAHRRAGG